MVLERMTGIEPALSAWKADVLPLDDIRVLWGMGAPTCQPKGRKTVGVFRHRYYYYRLDFSYDSLFFVFSVGAVRDHFHIAIIQNLYRIV